MASLLTQILARSRQRPIRWTAGLFLVVGLLSVAWPPAAQLLVEQAVVSIQVTDASGTLLREARRDGRSHPVPLDQVHPAAIAALIATEDRHFYRHPGINPLALGRALWANMRAGEVVSGGSTITMQVARALRQRKQRGLGDKLNEMHLALRLELWLTKAEILALWLNRVPFGNRTLGIEAAAQRYFGKSAQDLTQAEATFLIGLPQSPSRYDPFRHPERARARQQRVLAALVATDLLSPAEAAHLGALPLALRAPDPAFQAPHLVDFLLTSTQESTPLAEIRTTLDASLQQAVASLAQGHLRWLEAEGVGQAAAVVVENATGAVRAYLGSADYWDARSGGQNDGVRMLRQPGSALKPFTYARALQSGHFTTASVLPDIETPFPEGGGAFAPQNYDQRYHGPVPLRTALACSYNVPAVYVARAIGPTHLLQTLHDAGFSSLTRPAAHYGLGLTLGNGEVQLLELARAYAGLARGGSLPPLHTTQWHRTASGDTLHLPRSLPVDMGLTPQTTYLITDILRDPEAREPAFGRGGPLELPFPAATKTGTSKDYRDNWAIGYTPAHTVAVWVGNFDGEPMKWVSGVTGAGTLMKAILLELGSGGPFHQPPGLERTTICPASGLLPNAHCPDPRPELFLTGTAPTDTGDVHQLIAIDTRTGQRASTDTPPEAIDERSYRVYPPRYHGWMQENGLPIPPPLLTPTVPTSAAIAFSARLHVQYPEDGSIFQIDPILRPPFQRLHFRGAAEDGLADIRWWLDDQPLPGDLHATAWQLAVGSHTLELRATDGMGQPLRSSPITFQVVAPQSPLDP